MTRRRIMLGNFCSIDKIFLHFGVLAMRVYILLVFLSSLRRKLLYGTMVKYICTVSVPKGFLKCYGIEVSSITLWTFVYFVLFILPYESLLICSMEDILERYERYSYAEKRLNATQSELQPQVLSCYSFLSTCNALFNIYIQVWVCVCVYKPCWRVQVWVCTGFNCFLTL